MLGKKRRISKKTKPLVAASSAVLAAGAECAEGAAGEEKVALCARRARCEHGKKQRKGRHGNTYLWFTSGRGRRASGGRSVRGGHSVGTAL